MTLTDNELILLDGQCREETQREVDKAKARLAMIAAIPDASAADAAFIADAVTEAQSTGRLIFAHVRIRSCRVCKASGGYRRYTRNGRYHRKGDPNYDKPTYLNGVELAKRFVTMQGHATLGCCSDCFKRIQPALIEKLADVHAEISKGITGTDPAFKRFDKMTCEKCGWTGHEGQMRLLRAIMDGNYSGGCPNCPAENRFLGPTLIKHQDGFEVVAQR